MNYVMIAGVLACLGLGAAGGAFTYEATVVRTCAAGLEKLDAGKCPTRIRTAFDSAKLKAATKTIEYRDKTIPILVDNSKAAERQAARLQQSIDELSRVERTHACAESPAMRLRRQQLCDAEGGSDCGPADKDPR